MTQARGPEARRGLPFGLVLGAFVGLSLVALSQTELRDVDLYWHLVAGEELSSGVGPSAVGAAWSFGPSDAQWTSTQWLFELVLHVTSTAGGWPAVAAIRVVTGAIALAILARSTLRGIPLAIAAAPFAIAGAAVVFVSQERPQQVTLIGAALLGGVLIRGLREARLPHWYFVLPGTTLWANMHGGWILVPTVLALVVVGRALDKGLRDPVVRPGAVLAGSSVAAGLLTPSGLAGLSAIWRFRAATDLIREWQPTQPTYGLGTLTVAMLALLAVGWARSAAVPRSEMLVALIIVVFGWTAWRNVAPSLLLLAPIASHRLADAFPTTRRVDPTWSTRLGVGFAAGLAAVAIIRLPGQEHLPYATKPVELSQQIATLPAGQRVLNDYNTAGLVLYFGGPDTRVAIDGRADKYGADYIEDYLNLTNLRGEWADLLEQLDPTAALVELDSALAYELVDIRGWRSVGTENGFTLLVAP